MENDIILKEIRNNNNFSLLFIRLKEPEKPNQITWSTYLSKHLIKRNMNVYEFPRRVPNYTCDAPMLQLYNIYLCYKAYILRAQYAQLPCSSSAPLVFSVTPEHSFSNEINYDYDFHEQNNFLACTSVFIMHTIRRLLNASESYYLCMGVDRNEMLVAFPRESVPRSEAFLRNRHRRLGEFQARAGRIIHV